MQRCEHCAILSGTVTLRKIPLKGERVYLCLYCWQDVLVVTQPMRPDA